MFSSEGFCFVDASSILSARVLETLESSTARPARLWVPTTDTYGAVDRPQRQGFDRFVGALTGSWATWMRGCCGGKGIWARVNMEGAPKHMYIH